jgi:hypothetical protein
MDNIQTNRDIEIKRGYTRGLFWQAAKTTPENRQ